jgi:hypothetical protein
LTQAVEPGLRSGVMPTHLGGRGFTHRSSRRGGIQAMPDTFVVRRARARRAQRILNVGGHRRTLGCGRRFPPGRTL